MISQAALPFSRDEFLQVFEVYNQAVWPGQIALYLVALACLVFVFYDRDWARGAVLVILGGLWLWMGVVYHLLYFTRINPGAWGFGAAFIVQALLLFAAAASKRTRTAEPPLSRSFGAILVLYALVIYPILGALSDHAYPLGPSFGVPCPTTIFTFGILLLTSQSVPWWLFVIPALWALVAAAAPFQFGIWEDFGLIVAALVSVAVVIARSRRGASSVRLELSPPGPATSDEEPLGLGRLRRDAQR